MPVQTISGFGDGETIRRPERDTLGRFRRAMLGGQDRPEVSPEDVNVAIEDAFEPPYTFHEAAMAQMRSRGVDLSGQAEAYRISWNEDALERPDMPDEAPAVGRREDAVMMDEAVMLTPSHSFADVLRPARPRRENVPDSVLNIWITVRENKHAERISLRVGTDLIPFETEDALSWSRHEFEEWANEYLNSRCDERGNLPDGEWFDTYQWAREQVEARAASFYALKEREASVA